MAQLATWRIAARPVSRVAPHVGAGAHGLLLARSTYVGRHCSINRQNYSVAIAAAAAGRGGSGSTSGGSWSSSDSSSGPGSAADDSTGDAAGKTSKSGSKSSGTAMESKQGHRAGNPRRNTSRTSSGGTTHNGRTIDRGNAGSGAGAAPKQTADMGSKLQRPLMRSKQGRSVQSITLDIKSCNTIQQLQQLVQQDGQKMNYINLSAAIVKVQKLLCAITTQQQQQVQGASLFDQLWQLQQPKLSKCGTRALANMIYSVCLLPKPLQQQYHDTDPSVLAQHLLPAFMRQLFSTNAQDILNVLYGLAASGQQLPAQGTQMLVGQVVAVLPDASSQSIANTLWAVATMQHQVHPAQLQQLVDALCAVAQKATPQGMANTLWAVATMQQQIQPMQLQQLLDAFCAVAHKAKPQETKDTLWAVATMQQQVHPTQLRLLLVTFSAVAQKATPQEIANTLWAVATMKQQVEQGQLEQMLSALVMQLGEAVPQNVSNTLLACAEFRYLPKHLLIAPDLVDKLAAATPQQLANTAWACGQLGYRDEQLMSALLNHVLDLVGTSKQHLISNGVVAQNVANLCWSLAVLDMREQASAVLDLVQAGKPLWASMVLEESSQLYQVHMWLTDHSLAGGEGLAGVLTAQQLQQCQATWQQHLEATTKVKVGATQRAVFLTCQDLPVKWLVPPAMEQVSLGSDGQPDGAALIDITARTADGVWLAVEFDGPTHFRQPDGGLMGTTLYRNRALAARGYAVVSVPYYEWDTIRHIDRQRYMLDKVTSALQGAAANGRHHQHLQPE